MKITGFLLTEKDWQFHCWNPDECIIFRCYDDSYVVLEHLLECIVFRGTKEECKDFLSHFK